MDIYLIDGNSYVYRAFYAVRGLTTSKGLPTNAIFGFTNMLLKIIRDKKPDGVIMSFDTAAPTERHMLFKGYKANRPEAPAELIEQQPYIRKVVSAFNIKTFEMPGYEADDIIGTIAKRASGKDARIFIVTADKDMLQLVDDHIFIYDPMKDRVLDTAYVSEKFGVGPERVAEFMALTGDASDNIPGIKGIGEKTARELLTTFGSLDDLLNAPQKIKSERIRRMVAEGAESARLSRRLATIDTSVPIELEDHDLELREPDWLSLLALFRELEFTSMMRLLPAVEGPAREHKTILSISDLEWFASSIKGEFAFDVEATGRDPLSDSLVGIALCNDKALSWYLPLAHSILLDGTRAQLPLVRAFSALAPVFEDGEIVKIGHNLKYDILVLRKSGIDVKGPLLDTMVASYLLNPNKSGHSLDEVSFEYLSKRKRQFAEVLNKRASFADVPIDDATDYAAEDAGLSFELKGLLFEKLREQGLEKVYFDIEMPLIEVLAEIESAGIKIDSSKLQRLSMKAAEEIESIRKRIFFLAGEEFNINSPKQLSVILFHNLGLKPSKKTKTGFSTGMDVLEELSKQHELPREVLQYRTLTKLKTTYLDILPAIADRKTSRVHTSFNQTITATGRLSSSEPNLQNIPARGDWGRQIREAFIAEDGYILISADYSQIELRILAHLSGDEGLIDAFNRGLDIHARTAGEIYGVPLDSVTTEMRRVAKTVNFGVIYGISAFGLSETLGIDTRDADRFIKQYFEKHPGVKAYVDSVISETREKGYACTLLGRRRPIPELRHDSRTVRQQGERFAVNTPIQGTAADIIKIAMINVRNRLKKEGLKARMILQVHDELLVELPESEREVVKEIVRQEMEGAISLAVPVRVDIGFGKNWAEAH